MIIGAGFTGLIAAYVFPQDAIREAAPGPAQMHQALLRFRSDEISKLTGIPFKQVTVRKGIWLAGKFVQPSIGVANMYSQKCLGRVLGDRSIWNLETVQRFIAPPTFYAQLIDTVGHRIDWNTRVDFNVAKTCGRPFINTSPLPLVLTSLGIMTPDVMFEREPISVVKFTVSRCEAYQTVYFPSMLHSMYRASITGNTLICEFADKPEGDWEADLLNAFQLHGDLEQQEMTKQPFGKIAPIDNAIRKRMIHKLSAEHNIYSLGRFAVWRNILLDDMLQDATIVKRLLHANEYDLQIAAL